MVLETRLGDAGGREFDFWLLKLRRLLFLRVGGTRSEPLLFKGEDFAKTDVGRPGDAAVQ